MKKVICMALLSLLYILPVSAESTNTSPSGKTDANLYGHVINRKTGEHLAYVTISIPGTTIGTATDASGHYFLKNLPVGKLTVEAKLLGYTTDSKEVEIQSGESEWMRSSYRRVAVPRCVAKLRHW